MLRPGPFQGHVVPVRALLLGSFGLGCVLSAKRKLSICRISGEVHGAELSEILYETL